MEILKAPVNLSDDVSLRRFLQNAFFQNRTNANDIENPYKDPTKKDIDSKKIISIIEKFLDTYIINGENIQELSIYNSSLDMAALDYMSAIFFGNRCNIRQFSRNFCISAINKDDKGLGLYCEGSIYGIATNDDVFIGGGIYSSTGGNVCFSKSQLSPGDIVTIEDVLKIDMNNVFIKVEKSSNAEDKKAIGACAKIIALDDIKSYYPVIFDDNGTVKSQFLSFYNTIINQNYKIALVNSTGYGKISVCSENGNITAGDFICTSSISGKGKKQNESEYKNYTIAKALEDAVFSSSVQDMIIACEYK